MKFPADLLLRRTNLTNLVARVTSQVFTLAVLDAGLTHFGELIGREGNRVELWEPKGV